MHLRTSACLLLLSSSIFHAASFAPARSRTCLPIKSATSPHKENNEIFRLLSLHETPVRNNRYVKNSYGGKNSYGDTTSSSSKAEVSRLKFMINQMKGNMKESEMRASAAENRVAMLQAQIKALESESRIEENMEEELEQMKDKYEGNISKLKKKILNLTKTIDLSKSESEREVLEIKANHESEKIELQSKYDELKSDLEVANIELTSAREEASNLGDEIKLLEKNMNELEELLLGQIEDVTTRKDSEIAHLKDDAEEVRATLVKEIEGLEKKLEESELRSEQLMQDLEKAKRELTAELIAFKEKTRKELDALQSTLGSRESDIKARDLTIDTLHTERSSLRKLLRIQGSLVKKRIQKRLGRGK